MPGRGFEALAVRGVGQLHYLDSDHFRARDALLRTTGDTSGLPVSQVRYLQVEADRAQPDPRVRQFLEGRPRVASLLQLAIYEDVERAAQGIAMRVLREPIRQLRTLAGLLDAMRRLVVAMPDLNERQRAETEQMLGFRRFPPGTLPFMVTHFENQQTEMVDAVLRDRASALRLAQTGVEGGVDLQSLQARAGMSADGLQTVLTALEGGQVKALTLEGPLGDEVRDQTYRQFGFRRLHGNTYPHRQETSGIFPGPLAGNAADFTSLAEQMYANRAASVANVQRLERIVVVTGIIAGTVLLLLLANAAGAAVAGGVFGLASGTTAFVVTETVTSAAVFTLTSAAFTQAITGQGPIDLNDLEGSARRLGGDFLVNLFTFGFFRALNAVFLAGSRAGARVLFGLAENTAIDSSRAARTTVEALRLSATGATFIGLGYAQFRLQHGGREPTAGEAAELAYESLLTLVLLEAGARFSQPIMERIDLWARARQLSTLDPALRGRIDALLADYNTLNRDLAGYAISPQAANRDAPQLAARMNQLLDRHTALVNELRSSLRTGGAAQQVDAQANAELARVNAARDALREAQFFTAARIRPLDRPTQIAAQLEYTYAPDRVEDIRRFYGADNVRSDPDGTLHVRHQGRELIFRPEPAVGTAAPAGTPTTAGAAGQAAPAPTGAELGNRRDIVVSRAEALGIQNDPAIQAVGGRRFRPRGRTTPQALAEAEQLVGAAERVVTRAYIQRESARLQAAGQSLANVRTGELARLTDAQVADALAQIPPGAPALNEAELRGLLFAAQPPPAGSSAARIDIRRLFNMARSPQEAQRVLDAFGRFAEGRIPGTYQVLSDMVVGPGDWRGGAFQLEFARNNVGIARVAAFEVSEPVPGTTNRSRDYDILLTDGTRIELKDWDRWYADSLKSQFRRDVLIATNGLTNLISVARFRWVFRPPGPRTAAEIRATMREALEDLITEHGLSGDRADQLRRAFDAHTDLVSITDITASSVPVVPQTPGTPPTPRVLPPRRQEEQGQALLPGQVHPLPEAP